VMSGLGLPGALWLCRGAIRCELLGELEAWDDFDVMAEESDISLRSAVDRAKIEVSRTFHGGYSFKLKGGRKVDLWSVTSTRGRRCVSLGDALSTFEFNVDAIARSLRTGEIVDPLRVGAQILARELRLQDSVDSTNNPYLPWKAAYLVARHRFTPDASVARLWERPPTIAGVPDKAIPALREELSRLHIQDHIQDIRARMRCYPGSGEYLDALTNHAQNNRLADNR
jgi:hypothetical protein